MTHISVTESDRRHHVFKIDDADPTLYHLTATFVERGQAVEFASRAGGKSISMSWKRLDLSDGQRAEIVRRTVAGQDRVAIGRAFGLSADQVTDLYKRWRRKVAASSFDMESSATQSSHDGSLVKLGQSDTPAERRNLPTSEPPRAEVVKAVPSTGCSSAHPDQPDDVRTPKDDLGKEGLQPTISRGPWPVSNLTRILNVAAELVDFTIADIVKALPETPYGSITGTITKLIADGRLYRIRSGVYSMRKPTVVAEKPISVAKPAQSVAPIINPVADHSLTPKQDLSRAEVLAQIDRHVKTKGTMARPDFGDAEVNELWEKLQVRGHSLVKLPAKQHAGGRPFSLNHSPGITREELLRRAKIIITTEKPIGKVVP